MPCACAPQHASSDSSPAAVPAIARSWHSPKLLLRSRGSRQLCGSAAGVGFDGEYREAGIGEHPEGAVFAAAVAVCDRGLGVAIHVAARRPQSVAARRARRRRGRRLTAGDAPRDARADHGLDNSRVSAPLPMVPGDKVQNSRGRTVNVAAGCGVLCSVRRVTSLGVPGPVAEGPEGRSTARYSTGSWLHSDAAYSMRTSIAAASASGVS